MASLTLVSLFVFAIPGVAPFIPVVILLGM